MQDAITPIPQVIKVETDFHDLGMWGEYYGLIIHFDNGRTLTVRIEEHQFKHFNDQASAEKQSTPA